MFPFKFKEVVVAAGGAIRVVPTDRRTAFVNGAAALGLIEKHAHGFVHRVFAMPKHAHGFALMLNLLGEFLAGDVHR